MRSLAATFRAWLALPRAWLAIPLILLFWGLALFSLAGDSPTMDEQNHLARGLALLRTGDPRLSVEHPPLVNGFSALPLLLLPDIHLPTDHPSWTQTDGWYAFADQLLWVANHDVTRMVFLARLPLVVLTLALALAGMRLALALWGRGAGLVTFGLLLFDPNILAHGRYMTTDVGGALGLLLALWALWWLWGGVASGRVTRPIWGRLALAAVALAVAFGTKLSNLAFVPILGLLALLPLWPDSTWRAGGRRLISLLAAGLLSLLPLWLSFGLEWAPFRFAGSTFPWLIDLNPLAGPMPTFWQGVERMLDLGAASGRPSFLLGETSVTGFPLYFPIAFLVKTPLVSQALLLLAAILLLRDPTRRRRAIFLLLPAILFFGIMLTNSLNIGYRHLLPMLPVIYVLVGGLATVPAGAGRYRRHLPQLPSLGLLLLIAVDLWLFPHYLSYFNPLAGGPAGGNAVLIDSNVDWGQDLLRLRDWLAENEVETVKLGWFGTARPDYYGIDYTPLPGSPYHLNLFWDPPFNPTAPEPGVYAISVTALWELPLQEKGIYAWFRSREPDDRIGYSIFIYRVGGAE